MPTEWTMKLQDVPTFRQYVEDAEDPDEINIDDMAFEDVETLTTEGDKHLMLLREYHKLKKENAYLKGKIDGMVSMCKMMRSE